MLRSFLSMILLVCFGFLFLISQIRFVLACFKGCFVCIVPLFLGSIRLPYVDFSASYFDFSMALYIILFCKQLPLKGHTFFAQQFRVGLIGADVWVVFLLCSFLLFVLSSRCNCNLFYGVFIG